MKVIVLGMHRSGTSLASGLLSLSGVYFGPENEFIQANEENPKGFWERKDIRQLNDSLLHQMSCDWSEISNLYNKKIPDKVIEAFYSKANAIINKLYQDAQTGVIGLKEPRLCLLMPFWQYLLNENDFFLLVYRDPEEIAISLKNRNAIPFKVSNYLTEKYLELAIAAIKDRPHFIVSFKDLVENPLRSTQNIIAAINQSGKKLIIDDAKDLVEHASPELYRSKSMGNEFTTSKRLQNFIACMDRGELPHIESRGTTVPNQVLSYQHAKRFEEFRKIGWRLDRLEKQIQNLENAAVADQSNIDQLVKRLETTTEQLLEQKQIHLLSQSQHKTQDLTIQRLELAISNANEQIILGQSALATSERKFAESERELNETRHSAS